MKNLFTLVLLTTLTAPALGPRLGHGIVPENDLRIPVGSKANISERKFNAIIDRAEAIYGPRATALGSELSIHRYWESPSVNAYAYRDDKWRILMLGGMARHRDLTPDGFSLVVCHEIGHHFGGFPVKEDKGGVSVEGQADYYGVLKCLRTLWARDDHAHIIGDQEVPSALYDACAAAEGSIDKHLCLRSGLAALSFGKVLKATASATTPLPTVETPDASVAETTAMDYPGIQCRLDTYIQASLCSSPLEEETSASDERAGTCHEANGHTAGLRPPCWFRPSNSTL